MTDVLDLHRRSRTLADAGRLDEAIDLARAAVAAAPAHPGLHYTLGLMLDQRGGTDDRAHAIAAYAEATRLEPGFREAWNNLGLALETAQRPAEAGAAYRRAIAIDSEYAPAQRNLAALALAQGEYELALELARRVLTRTAGDPDMRRCEGRALLGLARFDAAKEVLDGLDASDWATRISVRLDLPDVHMDAASIAAHRLRYARGLAELQALLPAGPATGEQVRRGVARSNFLLAYHGEDDRALQQAYARLLGAMWERLPEPVPTHRARPAAAPGARLRVGFASAFFRDCTAGHYFASWITDLPAARFDRRVYLLGGNEDAVTERICRAAGCHVRLDGDLVAAARRIVADDLDVLVYPELGMDGRTFALAALRLAPLQCAGWGHPVTTGLETVDCFFSSALMEPPDGQEHYTERLVTLPGLGTRYPCPVVGATRVRADFGLPPGRTLYLFPHSVFKVRPENDDLLARVLAGDRGGDLVLCAGETERATRCLLGRLLPALAARGVDAARVRVLPPLSRPDYLELNRLCDVMLDATHWSGGNTTLDALAAGLPVVTRWGRFMRGRQSAGMLTAMGLADLIAADDDQWVAIATALGRSADRRRSASARIAAAREKLFDRVEPIDALASWLLQAAGRPAAP